MGKINSLNKDSTFNGQENDFACGICAYKSKNNNDVKKHRQEQHPKPPVYYSCSVCDTKCNDTESLNDHKKKHMKKINCNHCLFKADSKQELDNHISRRHKEKFECDWCDFVTHVKGDISEHEKNEHNMTKARKMHNCKKCENVYRSVSDLKNHENEVHSQESSRSMLQNKFSYEQKKRNGFCRFWNHAQCRFKEEDCKFLHKEAPFCHYQDQCREPRCQFFHEEGALPGSSRSFLGTRSFQGRWKGRC